MLVIRKQETNVVATITSDVAVAEAAVAGVAEAAAAGVAEAAAAGVAEVAAAGVAEAAAAGVAAAAILLFLDTWGGVSEAAEPEVVLRRTSMTSWSALGQGDGDDGGNAAGRSIAGSIRVLGGNGGIFVVARVQADESRLIMVSCGPRVLVFVWGLCALPRPMAGRDRGPRPMAASNPAKSRIRGAGHGARHQATGHVRTPACVDPRYRYCYH